MIRKKEIQSQAEKHVAFLASFKKTLFSFSLLFDGDLAVVVVVPFFFLFFLRYFFLLVLSCCSRIGVFVDLLLRLPSFALSLSLTWLKLYHYYFQIRK